MKYLVLLSSFIFISACSQNQDHMPIADLHKRTDSQQNVGAGANVGPYFKIDILPLVQKNCIACHGPGSGRDWTDYETFKSKKSSIETRVLSQNPDMPIGGKLSESDKKLLRDWIDNGMPYAPDSGETNAPPQAGGSEPVKKPTPDVAEVPAQAKSCVACHGNQGQSQNDLFPNLAGQQKDYLTNQLNAFHDKTRADDDAKSFMWSIAAALSNDDIKILATYFSNQPAVHNQPQNDSVAIANGKEIFNHGIAARGIIACASCHGEKAVGAGNIPLLAGQQTQYIIKQLKYFKSGMRKNDPSMPSIVKEMSDEEINDVAQFVNSL